MEYPIHHCIILQVLILYMQSSVTTIITVGYGDVHFVRFEEYIFSVFMMLLASAVFGYTTNIVIASFSNTDEELTQHELMIKRYMKKKKVKSSL